MKKTILDNTIPYSQSSEEYISMITNPTNIMNTPPSVRCTCRENRDYTKLLNKRNPYRTSVAYYLDFGNCNPHYLVPNCSAIIHVTGVGQIQGGILPKVAVSQLLWSPSETIFVYILVAESWFGAE